MIKNNIFIPILAIAMISTVLMTSQDAFAHNDPNDPCNSVAASSGITVFNATGDPVGAVIDGQSVTSSQDLGVTPNTATLFRCAFDGGTLGGFVGTINMTNPDGTEINVNTADIPCLGGTTNTGDLVLPVDCGTPLTTFTSNAAAYDVDCDDDGQNGDPVDGFLRFKAVFQGKAHQISTDTTPITKIDNIDIQCLNPFDHTTLSNPTGPDHTNVKVVTDTITVRGVNGTLGQFNATAALYLDGVNVAIPDDDGNVVCTPNTLDTDTFTSATTITCTWDRSSGAALANGNYCWMTTVFDHSGNYSPDFDKVNGCATGENPENLGDEQFSVTRPPFDHSTLSSPQGSPHSDVKVVTDTLTITGVNGTAGQFNATATLYLDGVAGAIPDDDGNVVCLPNTLDTDTFTSATTITCTWDRSSGVALAPGKYCWMTTVTDNLGNYNPATDTLNGCTDIGDNREDDRNEQFTVVPPFDFTTLSSPQGPGNLDVKVVTDTITVLGFNGTEGSFNATATLYLDGVGEVFDDDSTVECLPDPLVTDTFTSATTITCTWDRSAGTALLPGTYCWMVTVDEGNMNYIPDTVTHNACALIGDNPENDTLEQFTVVGEDGCTPGYWKNNLAKFPVENNWAVYHHETFADQFNGHVIDIKTNYNESNHKGQGKSSMVNNPILAETIGAQGGDVNALARHATAALLNSENPNVNYGLSTGQIQNLVWMALDGQLDINDVKNQLATENERGCPIDNSTPNQDPVGPTED